MVERRTESDMELVYETCEDIPRQLRASCSASIVSIDSAESRDASHNGEKKEPEKSPRVTQVNSTIILSSVSCLVHVTFSFFLYSFKDFYLFQFLLSEG